MIIRKRFIGALCSCFLLIQSNCTTESNPTQTTNNTPFSIAKSSQVERESQSPDSNLIYTQANSINSFAVELYKKLNSSQETQENLFFSPYSITTALAMTTAGAKGTTDEQIRTALQVKLDGDNFHRAMNSIDLSISTYANQTANLSLKTVNSAWCQFDLSFNVGYLNRIAQFYGAGINLVDFFNKTEETRLMINGWVSDQTNQKIKDLLPPQSLDPSTVLVLTNAIYFKANWLYPFEKENTSTKPFKLLDGTTIQVPSMIIGKNAKPGEGVEFKYTQRVGVRAINLPYSGNRLVMTVILPDLGNFNSFCQNLTFEKVNSLIQYLHPTRLPPIELPKFSYTFGTKSIKEPLKSLGMEQPFTPSADFSGIMQSPSLMIGNIYHKAFIAVDEIGTEAAAATAVIIGTTSTAEPPDFVADRPFIYIIRDTQTKTILFIGQVIDPSKS